MKKDYTVLLIQLDENLASDVSTRCSGRPQAFQENRVIFLQFKINLLSVCGTASQWISIILSVTSIVLLPFIRHTL